VPVPVIVHGQDFHDLWALSPVSGGTGRGGVVASPPSRTRGDMQLSRVHTITTHLLKLSFRRVAAGVLVVVLAGLVAGGCFRGGR
jgi:hypothetical protein